MAFWFGDGFDCYSAITDCGTYWDAALGGTATLALSATGRFAGSRGVTYANTSITPYITKTSGANDAVHHISVAFSAIGISAANNGLFFTLYDGTNAQCTICFYGTGSLLLISGAVNSGTTLATYTGAVSAANTWYQFEIEVAISNTAGYMNVRRNGNTSNDFSSATNLNTRAGSANNYANKIGVGMGANVSGTSTPTFDDFLWRSDASTVPWIGDVRCWTRMPATDASVAWSRSGTGSLIQTVSGGSNNQAISNTTMRLIPCTVNYNGSISGVTGVTNSAASGSMKCAIYADNSSVPGAVLATATPITTVPAGNNVFTITPTLTVTAGQRLWLAFLDDTSSGTWTTNLSASNAGTASATYATFPQANPVMTTGVSPVASSITYTLPASNAAVVSEPQQDAATTYVYSSTVSQSDLYGIASIGSTPSTIVGVTTRAYAQKSDAGTRNISVQLQSGAANVQSASSALNTTWGWVYRTDLTDPATGAAWTGAAVNNAQIGAVVTA